MSSNERVLEIIAESKKKHADSHPDGYLKYFNDIIASTNSICSEAVLKYREELPEVAIHLEHLSNRVLAGISKQRDLITAEKLRVQVRLETLDELSREIVNDSLRKSIKKKPELSEELEK